jgi:excisionase family DNA binding protein
MARRKKISTAQPLLLSIADVAIQLGVCRTTVYKYIYHEGLPSMLLRGVRRVRRVHPDSLHQWLKSQEERCA